MPTTEAFPSIEWAQGITVNWANQDIVVTSVSYSRSASAEIELTHMYSKIHTDPNNSDNRRVVREFEVGVVDLGEVQFEFFGPSSFTEDLIGTKGELMIDGLTNAPNGTMAYLTNLSIQAKAGELVSGSCTFKLSGA